MADGRVDIDVRARTDKLPGDLSKAQKEINRLTGTFDKQVASIEKQEVAILDLRRQLKAIADSEVTPKDLPKMESQLKRIFADADKLNEETLELKKSLESATAKLAEMEAIKTTKPEDFERVQNKVNKLTAAYEKADQMQIEMLSNAEELAKRIEEVKLSPETSAEAQKLADKITLAETSLESLKDKANETSKQIKSALALESEPAARAIRNIESELEKVIAAIEQQRNTFQDSLEIYEQAKIALKDASLSGDELAESLAKATLDRAESDVERANAKVKTLYYEAQKLSEAFDRITLDPANADVAHRMQAEISGTTFMLSDAAESAKTLSGEISLTESEIESIRIEAERMAEALVIDSSPAEKAIRNIGAEIESVADKIEQQNQKYRVALAIFEQSESALQAARDAGDEMAEALAKANLERATKDIDAVDSKTKSLQYEALKLKEAFNLVALDPANVDVADRMQDEIIGFKSTLDSATQNAKALSTEINEAFDIGNAPLAEEEIQKVDSRIQQLIESAKSGAAKIGNVFSNIASGFGKLSAKILAGIGSVKLFGKNLSGLNGHAKHASNGFQKLTHRITAMLATVLVFNVIRKAMTALRDTMGALLQSNAEFAASWNAIKVNLLTAFAPIWETIQPALISFMNVLAQVTAMMAQFVSLVFGKSVSQSKAAAKAMNDQANALDKTGKAAKKAGIGLQGFDEINQAVTESAEAGGEGVSGLDFEAVEIPETSWIDELREKLEGLTDVYEIAYEIGSTLSAGLTKILDDIDWDSIKNKAKEWADRLAGFLNGFIDNKEMWASLGRTLGEGINTALEFLEEFIDRFHWKELGEGLAIAVNELVDTIDWEKAGEVLGNGLNGVLTTIYTFFTDTDWEKVGTSIATGLNTAMETLDWQLLGATFASKWNALIDGFYGFVTTFDWAKFGSSISEAANAWFAEIEWTKLGVTVSEGFLGILNTIGTAIREFDWKKVGEDIKDFLVAIDWVGIIQEMARVLGNAIGGLAALLWVVIEDAVNSIGDFFTEAIEEMGGDVGKGILYGIVKGLGDILQWLWDNVAQPLIDGFKEVFDIHSPSAVMAELGVYLIQGLLNGITSLRDDVITFFSGLWSGIQEIFQDVGQWFSDIWNGITDFLFGIFTGDWERAWEGVAKIFKTVFTGIERVVKGVVNTVIDLINGMIRAITDGINVVIRALNSIKIDIPEWVPGFGGKSFGISLAELTAPVIPRLAKGGLAYKELFAIVGDNPNASTDPEVISPLSTLSNMISAEMAKLLSEPIIPASVMNAIAERGRLQSVQAEISDSSIAKFLNGVGEQMALIMATSQADATTGGQSTGNVNIDGRKAGELLLDGVLLAASRRGINLNLNPGRA